MNRTALLMLIIYFSCVIAMIIAVVSFPEKIAYFGLAVFIPLIISVVMAIKLVLKYKQGEMRWLWIFFVLTGATIALPILAFTIPRDGRIGFA